MSKIARIMFQIISRILLVILFMGLGVLLYRMTDSLSQVQNEEKPPLSIYAIGEARAASPTIPPTTPLPTLTPSQTLKPPPTLEPPTSTPQPTYTPSVAPTATIDTSITVQGLNGAATPTPSGGSGGGSGTCTPREDWGGVHVVAMNEALSNIAAQYGLSADELASGNCLTNKNLIVVNQELRVPGEGAAASSSVQVGTGGGQTVNSSVISSSSCTAWEVIIPVDNTVNVGSTGTVTFQWRGPEAFRYLLRIIAPDNSVFESVFDIRQNETIDASKIPLAGTYTWYVYPLNENFQQTNCKEGGPWRFTKVGAPTATPTVTPQPPTPTFITNVNGGIAPLEVQFVNQTSGTITELLWSFGDGGNWQGTPQTAGRVSHVYTVPGDYLVTLWVKGPGGESTTSRFISVQ